VTRWSLSHRRLQSAVADSVLSHVETATGLDRFRLTLLASLYYKHAQMWTKLITSSDQCVCLSVCLSVCSHQPYDRHQFFLFKLPVSMALSCFGSVVIRCVLPVLWMTLFSYLGASGPKSSNVMFGRNSPDGGTLGRHITTVFNIVHQNAVLG